jgi:hypothetical protein
MKNRACRNRRLVPACSAAPELSLHMPEFGTPTNWARETIAPAQLGQIIKASLIRSKALLELNQGSRIIFFHTKTLYVVAG